VDGHAAASGGLGGAGRRRPPLRLSLAAAKPLLPSLTGRRTTGRGRQGAVVWPVVAGGSGGWRLKMNRMPLISYPTAAKSTDQR